MPTNIDPYVFSNIQQQGTQNQLAQLQLRQQQQEQQTQNTLRQLLKQPGMTDPATGLPTTNALGAITRVDPAAGIKLIGDISLMEERKVQAQKAQSELYMARQKADAEELAQNVAAYDADVSSGSVDPAIAETRLRSRMKDYIFNQPVSDDEKQKAWAKVGGLSLPELRALSITAEQRAKLADKEPYRDESGNTVFLDKQGNVYDANGKRIPAPAGLERLPTPFDTRRLTAERTPYQTPDGKTVFVAKDGTVTDASGNVIEAPAGLQKMGSGGTSSRSGVAAVINAATRERAAKGLPPMSTDDILRLTSRYNEISREAGAAGTRAGAVQFTVRELEGLLDPARVAFSKLDRSSFVPFNKLRQLYETNTGNAEQRRAYVAARGAANAYARAVSPTGVPRESDIAAAENILNTADSPEQFQGALDQLDIEAKTILSASEAAKMAVTGGEGGVRPAEAAPSPAESPTGKWSSPDEVKQAFLTHKLTREEAIKILRDRGWKK